MTNEEAIQKIDKASFTGSDGLDYVETLVALDVIKMVTTSCEDTISRQAVLDIIEDKIKYGLAQLDPDEIIAISQYYHMEVEKLPSVKPQEPKTGHWIDHNNGAISCSYCHTWFNKDDRYSYMNHCPNCGAKMESEDKE